MASTTSAKNIEKHVIRNKKMLAIDRLKSLLDDENSFLELSLLCGMGMKYGDIPRAGVITGKDG